MKFASGPDTVCQLEGASGAPDLRSAADPGAGRTGDSRGGRADCRGTTDSGAEC